MIYKDKEGKISERIVSYIPDRDYLLKHKGDISHNKINKLDKDFNGYLRYSSWDGTPLFMLRITNGKATMMAFSPIDDLSSIPNILGQKRINAKGKLANNYEDCTFIIEYVYEQTCYFDSPEDTEPAYCDEPMVISETIVDMVCPSDPGDPCADPANFGNGDCGSEWEESDDPSAKDSLKKIMKDTCLNASQVDTLANMFKDWLNGQGQADAACLHKEQYEYMVSNGIKFSFCVNSNSPAYQSYNPINGGFQFQEENALKLSGTFGHEFFHAYQDAYLPNGTNQYAQGNGYPNGYINIEFETALYIDLMRPGADQTAFSKLGIDENVKAEYILWLNSITANNTTFPTTFADFNGQYFYFLGLFKQHSGYSDMGNIINTMQPLSLLNLLSTTNCR